MRTLGILLAVSLATAMAQDKAKQGKMPPPPPLKLSIAAFSDGGDIPVKFTCSAQPSAVSPAMQWSVVPTGTVTFAMILHDPDAQLRARLSLLVLLLQGRLPAGLATAPAVVPSLPELEVVPAVAG